MVAVRKEDEQAVESARQSLFDNPPEGFEWINDLKPLHQRLFAVELADALHHVMMSRDRDPSVVLDLLASWEATAELDADSESAADLLRLRDASEYVEWNPKWQQ